MNEYLKLAEGNKQKISELSCQIRFLKSMKFNRKADGEPYKKKHFQSDLVKHFNQYGRNYYYLDIPKSDLQGESSCANYERIIWNAGDEDLGNLENVILDLIQEKEKSLKHQKDTLRRNLALNDYLNQYLAVKKAYLEIIKASKDKIQKQIEELYPDYAFIAKGSKLEMKVSENWDNENYYSLE